MSPSENTHRHKGDVKLKNSREWFWWCWPLISHSKYDRCHSVTIRQKAYRKGGLRLPCKPKKDAWETSGAWRGESIALSSINQCVDAQNREWGERSSRGISLPDWHNFEVVCFETLYAVNSVCASHNAKTHAWTVLVCGTQNNWTACKWTPLYSSMSVRCFTVTDLFCVLSGETSQDFWLVTNTLIVS